MENANEITSLQMQEMWKCLDTAQTEEAESLRKVQEFILGQAEEKPEKRLIFSHYVRRHYSSEPAIFRHCFRCGYLWNQRGLVTPRKCPFCKSKIWSEEFHVRHVHRTSEHQSKLNDVNRLSHKTPEYRKRLSSALKAKWSDPVYKADRVERYRKSMLPIEQRRRMRISESHSTELARKQNSERMKKLIASGKRVISPLTGSGRHGYYLSSKCKRRFLYRSSWELIFMEHMESDSLVQKWTYEKLRIPYILNGNIRTYIIDFMVFLSSGDRVAVEIKPSALLALPQNVAKFSSARRWCSSRGIHFLILSSPEQLLIPHNEIPRAEIQGELL